MMTYVGCLTPFTQTILATILAAIVNGADFKNDSEKLWAVLKRCNKYSIAILLCFSGAEVTAM